MPDVNYRDVFLQGDCDAVVAELCQAADEEAATAARQAGAVGGWARQLDQLVQGGPQGDVWQMLVDEQGEGIDVVQNNVNSAHANVASGEKTLRATRKSGAGCCVVS